MFTPPIASDALFHRKALLPVINPDQPGTDLPHPAPRAPRIFADSATRADIEPLFRAGIINGITTNPSLLKKAGAKSWDQAKGIMRDLCALLHPHPVSLELTETREEEMVKQASELSELGDNSVIKVPIGGYRALDPKADPFTGLKVIRRLWQKGIKVNTTLVFNTTQALWAANAGAAYVSPFLGRLADYAAKNDQPDRAPGNSLYWVEDTKKGAPPAGEPVTHNTEYVASGGPLKDAGARLIFEIAAVFANYRITTEILAASIRNPVQLTECLLAGADILTVPAPVLSTVADHPLSDAGMKAFAQDATAFGK
ncbi:MAG TPA: transaldolase family protein [Polyangia bacterium]|nr:transaldolase family protein [Polyangia bacterium]